MFEDLSLVAVRENGHYQNDAFIRRGIDQLPPGGGVDRSGEPLSLAMDYRQNE